MAEVLKCSQCGSTNFWNDPADPRKHKCKYCGTELTEGDAPQAQAPNPEPKEAPPEAKQEEPTQPAAGTSNETFESVMAVGCTFFFFLLIVGFFGWVIYQSNQDSYYAGKINTLGQYTVAPLVCPSGDPVEIEFGYKGNPPIIQVFPYSANDHWKISAADANQMQVDWLKSYMWVHCVNVGNKPEYYVYGTNSGMDIPKDGMQVVFKEK